MSEHGPAADVVQAIERLGDRLDTFGDRLASEWSALKVEMARSTAVQEAIVIGVRSVWGEVCATARAAAASRVGTLFLAALALAIVARVWGMDVRTVLEIAGIIDQASAP